MESVDLFSIKALWGNLNFDHAVGPLVVFGIRPCSSKITSPNQITLSLWESETVIMEDFNEVCYKHERFGTMFNSLGANVFNNFISLAGLIDLPLEGYTFTWAHKSASKMSKLERFLISEETTWKSMNLTKQNGLLRMKKKLELLKSAIKTWTKDARTQSNAKKVNIQHKLSEVDKILDKGMSNDEAICNRTNLLKELQDLNTIDATDISQKAKIYWSIEGDENTKYFHGILNKKRYQLAIRETLVNGEWISNPDGVKHEFFNHFNGFTFEFFRKFWKLIDKDVFQAVLEFFESGHISRGCNASFIALIPKIQDAKLVKEFRPISLIGSIYKIIAKILANRLCIILPCLISEVQSAFVSNRHILDGPFLLNELLAWCKHKKKSSLIFKVDFKKAFDVVKWDYLINTLKAFSFGQKWCKWITGCLETATGSVIVNGSPTPEFQFHKCLKQGCPISLFLFIMIMETLHLSFKRVINAGLYRGLKINYQKSKLMGVGVDSTEIEREANSIGCSIFSTAFRYLGIKVGDNMSRVNSWEDVISKVSSRLSKWKIKTLLIGALDSCISSTRRSPWLDIIRDLHSLKSKGIDLMQFIRKKIGNGENTSFWADSWLGDGVIKSLYPRLFSLESNKSVTVAKKLRHPSLFFSFRMAPRGWEEQQQLNMLTSCINDIILPNMSDRWTWSLDASGSFSVKSTRNHIDDILLPKVNVPTRWVKVIPIKVNIYAWRVCLDKIPTRLNLSSKGIDIPSILCPICNLAVESTSHIFFTCPLARQIRSKVMRWWELDDTSINCYGEWLN
ncbi:RNA-directed DNA polymerase, eukaryota [Tanacetum coccineum]